MKILHIISGDLWAGAEVQALTLLTALQKMEGIEVAAALMNEGELAKRLRERNILVMLFPENRMSAVRITAGLRALMQRWQPDIVHTHRIKENILGSISNRLSRRVPCVRTIHGASEHTPKGLLQLHKRVLNYLNCWTGIHLQQKFIAVSQDLAENLVREYPREQIVVIQNGVDIDAVRAQANTVKLRDIAPTARHIGIVGRLVPVKRVDIFLEIAALLHQQYPEQDWHFHIFGDGPLHSALTAHAAKLQLLDIVTFHGHRNDIIPCIAALDALIMCSDHEGLPMTLLESMSAGTPVIAHDTGGMHTVLSPIAPLWLVQEHTPSAYAQAITDLLETDAGWVRPEIILQYVREKLSAEINASETAKQYRELQMACAT